MLVKLNLQDFIPTLAFLLFTFSFSAKVEINLVDFTNICIVLSCGGSNDYIGQPMLPSAWSTSQFLAFIAAINPYSLFKFIILKLFLYIYLYGICNLGIMFSYITSLI